MHRKFKNGGQNNTSLDGTVIAQRGDTFDKDVSLAPCLEMEIRLGLARQQSIKYYLTKICVGKMTELILQNQVFGSYQKTALNWESSWIEAFHKVSKSIDQLSRSKSPSVVKQVSHDLSSPLGAIKAASFHIENKEVRDVLNLAAERIQDILDDLRAETIEETALPADEFGLDQVLSNVIREQRVKLNKDIDVDLSFDLIGLDYNASSIYNKNQLCRVISNLINNSLEAKKESGLKLKVRMKSLKNHYQITVSDNGNGIRTENMSKVFEQGVSFKKYKPGKNWGLGLYHAKTVMELWGGKIRVRSRYGEGTTFVLTIKKGGFAIPSASYLTA